MYKSHLKKMTLMAVFLFILKISIKKLTRMTGFVVQGSGGQ